MSANHSSKSSWDPQGSQRILPFLFDESFTDDIITKPENTRSPAGADNPYDGRAYQPGEHAYGSGQSAERRGGGSTRDGQRTFWLPGGTDDDYRPSSDTFRDEDKHDLEVHGATPFTHFNSSTVAILDRLGRSIPETDQAQRLGENLSFELEKGESHSKEYEETNGNRASKRYSHGSKRYSQRWENDVVGWEGPNDPQNPQNWKKSKKYIVTIFYASLTFCITFASSILSSATEVIAKEYGVSTEVMAMGTSIFVFVSPSPSFGRPTLTDMIGIRRRPNHMGALL